MKKKKLSTDVNVNAFEILKAATGEPTEEPPKNKKVDQPEKNPAAVALGRLGGLKGGKARAAKLTTKQRKAIAKEAARARWSRQK
ncbi:MAG TPA: hypothetical protein PKD12_15450 [Nitrospira sp.]|nr:hypothetical protein [Nitrospira sp.]